MFTMRSLPLATIGVALLATSATALAAPVSTSPPAVSGAPTYLSTLRCDPGAWSGAATLAYSWREGSFQWGSGPTLPVAAALMGRSLRCHVIATDAAGATAEAASPAVVAGPAPMTLAYRLTSPKAGRIALTGTVGPRAGIRLGAKRSTLVLYRVKGSRLLQINIPPLTVPASGRVKLNLKDVPGRHTYRIQLSGPDPSVFAPFTTTVKLTVKRPAR